MHVRPTTVESKPHGGDESQEETGSTSNTSKEDKSKRPRIRENTAAMKSTRNACLPLDSPLPHSNDDPLPERHAIEDKMGSRAEKELNYPDGLTRMVV